MHTSIWRTRRESLAAMDRYLPGCARRHRRVAGPFPDFGQHLSDRATLCGITRGKRCGCKLSTPSAGTRRSTESSVTSTSSTTVRTGGPGSARPRTLAWGAHRLERSEIAQVIERDVSRSTLAARVSVATPLTLRVSSVEYRGSIWRLVMPARCAESRVPTTKRVHRA